MEDLSCSMGKSERIEQAKLVSAREEKSVILKSGCTHNHSGTKTLVAGTYKALIMY